MVNWFSAAKDVWIEATGDLNADTVYSRADLRPGCPGLHPRCTYERAGSNVPGDLVDATKHAPEINLRARNIALNAATGSGKATNELDVGVNRDGFVSASAPTSGLGTGVYLNAPSGEYFNVGDVASGDAVTLRSATDMIIDGAVTGPGPFAIRPSSAWSLDTKADLHATTQGLLLRAGSLEMQDAQHMLDNGETVDAKYLGPDPSRSRPFPTMLHRRAPASIWPPSASKLLAMR